MSLETKCPNCGEVVMLGGSKCSKCGAPMPPPSGEPPKVPQQTRCPNCGRPVDDGQGHCPLCGKELGWAGKRGSAFEKVGLGLLFLLVGVPAGLVGACTGMFTGFPSPRDWTMATITVGGLGICGLLLWLWIAALKKGN